MKLNFKKMNGLIPAIVQDNSTMQVLMLGFMNEEAYNLTRKTGKVVFWSRTRKKLWQKGGTSGKFLEVVSMCVDCDNDTLLILAKPSGNTCHKGSYSCFGEKKLNLLFFEQLFELLKDRKKNMMKKSYTSSLFKKGLSEIVKKFGEESIEVVVAATLETKKRLIYESCDLLYHLFVLLASKDIELDEIVYELARRQQK